MNESDRYIRAVLQYIQAPGAERQRIEADLRAHFEEAMQAGETPEAVIVRMGSPSEVAAEFMSQTALPYAGFWRRLVAFIIDVCLIILAGFVCGISFIPLSNRIPQNPQGWDYVIGAILIALCAGCALATVGVVLLYFPILEGRFGQTPGKRLLRLCVLREDGLPIHYKEAFLRRISYYFDVLPIDALFVFFNPRRQRAFDIIARTIVIRKLD
jgi:uncharacterized RDD family membrane protein YckC